MKKMFLLPLMTVVAMTSSQAYAICASPEPITCALTAALIAGGVFRDLHGTTEVVSLQSTSEKSEIAAISQAVRENKSLHYRMAEYYSHSPGYGDIIRRFEAGKITGSNSLESLKKFDPQLFAGLDALDAIISSKVQRSSMLPAKNQWERYYQLAGEAKLVYKNTFVK